VTPRQPDRDHLSRLTGANSRPGNGGHEIRDARTFSAFPEPLFPFPGKEDFVFWGSFCFATFVLSLRTLRLKALKTFDRKDR
jgi:hypothetical protein